MILELIALLNLQRQWIFQGYGSEFPKILGTQKSQISSVLELFLKTSMIKDCRCVQQSLVLERTA